ncbi:acetylornithine deacetylase/succinyl-diaminopimelate desuccinylase family protein [Gammaproteobacteria bacterium]|nr:acetylornithine deacetylase/succinyl-diaminopimelate desuccinylase family protein [Gammaproteobacteria bacterium]
MNNQTLIKTIKDKEDELISLTQDLIRIPTVNPPGEFYSDCVEYLNKRFKLKGFETQIIRAKGTPGDTDQYPRQNIIAHISNGTGPCVHFNSHIDVVAVGSGWTQPPFEGKIIGDRIYGRGSCDMKGGLAASIIAVEAYLEVNPNFVGSIEISGTADEETGGYGGVGYLAEKGILAKPRIDHVIIPEPLNKDRICLGHRGVWWAEIETLGKIAHGSMPFDGDSAIRHMQAVLERFEKDLYPLLKNKKTDMPVVPDGAKESTMNINSIHGGETEEFEGLPSPLVADSCRIIIDRRFLIEEKLEEVKDEVAQILEKLSDDREGFLFKLKDLFEVIPSMTSESAPVVRAVEHAITSILGKEPEMVVSPGTYDQKHIDRIGKLEDCIAYGPGILTLAHQADEYVNISDMVDSACVMGCALDELLHRKNHEPA